MDSSILTLRTGLLLVERASGYFSLLPCFIEIPLFNVNSVDSDQTPHSAASDLGLHCLPMSILRDTRHKWVKVGCSPWR